MPSSDESGGAILHDWKRDEDGNIDIFAMAEGYHNGPVCLRCGDSFCHHCTPACYQQPCPKGEDA